MMPLTLFGRKETACMQHSMQHAASTADSMTCGRRPIPFCIPHKRTFQMTLKYQTSRL